MMSLSIVKHIHLNSARSTSTSTKLSSAQNIMARRSSPAPGTGTDLKLSLGVSSIQDSVHAKLEVHVAISRSNRQKLQQLLVNPITMTALKKLAWRQMSLLLVLAKCIFQEFQILSFQSFTFKKGQFFNSL